MLQFSLPVNFYNRPAQVVARELLGTRLIRNRDGLRLAGYIIETEAYDGESDLACHARAGRTNRTEIMYGKPGKAYIYFIYGIHWMLNCVTGEEGQPAAVLIRALLPDEGLDEIAQRRIGVRRTDWTNGPAKLCQALQISGNLNGIDLTDSCGELWIEAGKTIPDTSVQIGPRVGIQNVPEPWRSVQWRFWLSDLKILAAHNGSVVNRILIQ